jgi:hypothetical protein
MTANEQVLLQAGHFEFRRTGTADELRYVAKWLLQKLNSERSAGTVADEWTKS